LSRSPQHAGGLQITILILAVLFLGEFADRYVFRQWQLSREYGIPIGNVVTFVFAGLILFGVPALRRLSRVLLSAPLAPGKKKEVALVLVLMLVTACAVLGAVALWWWSTGGEPALARRVGGFQVPDPWSRAFSARSIVTTFVVSAALAPFFEELVFRGILFPAWSQRLGWVGSAVATSAVFAIIHPFVIPQFFTSIVLVCLYRRTGSLWACIIAHGVFNLLLWHPLVGQFLLPGSGKETGEISFWSAHLACLAVALFAIPAYMWMSRDAKAAPSMQTTVTSNA
jgi:membrane protease YdiL (CAAX protease family)